MCSKNTLMQAKDWKLSQNILKLSFVIFIQIKCIIQSSAILRIYEWVDLTHSNYLTCMHFIWIDTETFTDANAICVWITYRPTFEKMKYSTYQSWSSNRIDICQTLLYCNKPAPWDTCHCRLMQLCNLVWNMLAGPLIHKPVLEVSNN